MSDIVTRLLLKTNDFDANLNKSKQSVNIFQSGISSATQTAGAGIAKFAGAIGLAVGATEAFNKTIGSSQTTGDAFTKIMDQSKASVDAFFTSIAMGDFSGFLTNLVNVIDKSGDLSAMLDELATKTLFSNSELSTLLLSKRIQENIAKDKTKSDKERNAALLEARSIQLEINKLQSGLANTTRQAAYAALDSAMAIQGLNGNVSRDSFDWAMKESNRARGLQLGGEYKGKVADYDKRIENAKETNPYTGDLMHTKESTRLLNELNSFKNTKQGKLGAFLHAFYEAKDEETISYIGQAKTLHEKANQMIGSISDSELLLNNTDAKINGSFKKQNGGGAGGGGGADNPAPSGSLAYFDTELAKKNKELINATDAQARAAVQATINELERQKIELLITGKDGSLEALSIQIASLKSKYTTAVTDEAREEIQKLITDLESKTAYINGKAKAPLKKSGLPTQGYDTKKINPFKTKSPISKKDIKLNEEYNESLAEMGSIMGLLSGAFDGNTQSVLQWGVTLLSTIGQAIPAIESMIPAKKQDAAASKEKASAAMLAAGAETMEAHAGIPFAGIAIGLAGVASIIAVLSSMPKFATGGVVPGVSFTGDKVPAWLNSGEMILNGGQQSNLFRMLNAGLYAGITAEQVQPSMGNVSRFIMPDESNREVRVSGNFRVKGCDLELAIKNRISKTGKKSW